MALCIFASHSAIQRLATEVTFHEVGFTSFPGRPQPCSCWEDVCMALQAFGHAGNRENWDRRPPKHRHSYSVTAMALIDSWPWHKAMQVLERGLHGLAAALARRKPRIWRDRSKTKHCRHYDTVIVHWVYRPREPWMNKALTTPFQCLCSALLVSLSGRAHAVEERLVR